MRYRSYVLVFFFKQQTAYDVRISDWSSDVCSSDLYLAAPTAARNVTIAADGDIDGGTIIADGDIALTAGGAIAIAQATMQGDGLLSLAGTDGISVDTLVSPGRTSPPSRHGPHTIANLASPAALNAAGDSNTTGRTADLPFAPHNK